MFAIVTDPPVEIEKPFGIGGGHFICVFVAAVGVLVPEARSCWCTHCLELSVSPGAVAERALLVHRGLGGDVRASGSKPRGRHAIARVRAGGARGGARRVRPGACSRGT